MSQLPTWPSEASAWGEYFDTYAPVYERASFASGGLAYVGDQEVRDVLAILRDRAPGCVLDAGAGSGRIARAVAAMGWQVTAADVSTEMLRRVAHDVAGAATVHAALGHPLPFANDAFDAVIAVRVLKYVDDPAYAVAELARVLRPGGVAIVEFTNRRSAARFGYGDAPACLVTLREAATMFADAGLRVVERRTGTYLPQPVWRRAGSAKRVRVAVAVERAISTVAGGPRGAVGARSVLLVGAPM